jgi:hypothetical protein
MLRIDLGVKFCCCSKCRLLFSLDPKSVIRFVLSLIISSIANRWKQIPFTIGIKWFTNPEAQVWHFYCWWETHPPVQKLRHNLMSHYVPLIAFTLKRRSGPKSNHSYLLHHFCPPMWSLLRDFSKLPPVQKLYFLEISTECHRPKGHWGVGLQTHPHASFLDRPLKTSLWGWHETWFYCENNEPSLPSFVRGLPEF